MEILKEDQLFRSEERKFGLFKHTGPVLGGHFIRSRIGVNETRDKMIFLFKYIHVNAEKIPFKFGFKLCHKFLREFIKIQISSKMKGDFVLSLSVGLDLDVLHMKCSPSSSFTCRANKSEV